MSRKYLLIPLLMYMFTSVIAFSQTVTELYPDDVLTIQYIEAEKGSSKSIFVGNVRKTEGDQFLANDKIIWPENITYIKVINKRTWETLQITSENFQEEPVKFYNAYIKNPILGSKGSDINDKVQAMKSFMSKEFYMLDDNIMIYSTLVVDKDHTYYLVPLGQPNAKPFQLMSNPDEPYLIYIPMSQLNENNVDITHGCRFKIIYITINESALITETFSLKKYN